MKKPASLIGILIIFSLISCKKENDDPIIGQWKWFKTCAGENGYYTTSESVDSTYYIEFSKTGFYYLYDNSKKLINTRKYELGQGGSSNTFKFPESDIADFTDGYRIQNDTLSIWNLNGILLWTSYYQRLK
jgi:hypothetical protein